MNQEPAAPPNNRWPPQAKYIVGNEAAERFSYYGMVSILMFYLTDVLQKSKDDGTIILHGFKFVNYFMPLLGAWVSDRLWGRYRSILWISLAYCVGHALLAFGDLTGTREARTGCLYGGLLLIALGSGGIKPSVSAFLGDQFGSDQGHLLRQAYAAFYWAVNLGAVFSQFLIPQIKNHSWAWAFGVPGIMMGLATFIFWWGTPHYRHVPPARVAKTAGFFQVLWCAFKNRSRRSSGRGFWEGARARFSDQEVEAARSVGPILSIFAMVPMFWALFDQTHSTWVLQGRQMLSVALPFSFVLDAAAMQMLNSVLILILVPFLTLICYPRLGRLASPLRRMAAGLFLAASSYVLVAWLQHRVDSGPPMSILWQSVPYLVLTTSEVLVSTTGLEFAFREAAPSMKSTMIGFWYLTVALGNLVVMALTGFLGSAEGNSSVTPQRFMLYAALTFVVAIIFSIIATRYRYRDAGAARGC